MIRVWHACLAILAACNTASPKAGPAAAPAAAKGAPAAKASGGDARAHAPGALSLAGDNGCVVTPERELRCWGRNDSGQLGHGDFAEHWGAVAVKGLANVARVAVGHRFACASLLDGSVSCWGDNESGQLGTKASAHSPVPAAVPGVRDAIAIVASYSAACAVSKDEAVTCWGDSAILAPAAGCQHDLECAKRVSPGPTVIPSLRGSVEIALSSGGGCALRENGSVACWGGDFRGDDAFVSALAAMEPLVTIASGAVGQHACGIDRRGTARCWGNRGFGKLDGRRREPGQDSSAAMGKPLDALAEVVVIATGMEHSCARTRAGKIWCWGQAHRFATSKDDLDPKPRLVENFSGPLGLSAAWYRSCALGPELRVSCWGELDSRLFSRGAPRFPWQFRKVELRGAVDVAVGSVHSCAVVASGSVLCWGMNHLGQLGAEGPFRAYSPIEVPGVRDAASVTCAYHYCSAILRDGKVVGWGTMPLWGSPSRVTLLESEPSIQVALTDDLSCRLLRSGRVRCFDADVPFPEKVLQIAAENRLICARTATGRVFCSHLPSTRPEPLVYLIEKLPPVTTMHSAWSASDARGRTFTWRSSRVAREEEAPITTPPARLTRDLAGARKLVSSNEHACALFEDGSVGCQGEAYSGALGVGYHAPVPLAIDMASGPGAL